MLPAFGYNGELYEMIVRQLFCTVR